MTVVFIAAFVGAVIGSFLNVVIARLPEYFAAARPTVLGALRSLSVPGSSCCHCCRKLSWWENVPIFSYLLLGRKCRTCRSPISARYAVVELMTVGGYVALAFMGRWDVWASIFIAFNVALAYIDIENRVLPDALTLLLLLLGCAHALTAEEIGFVHAMMAAALGYAYFILVAKVSENLAGRPALGGGDAKLVAALGAWLGLASLVIVVAIASVVSLVIVLIIRRSGRTAQPIRFPFGAALSFAGGFFYLLPPHLSSLQYAQF